MMDTKCDVCSSNVYRRDVVVASWIYTALLAAPFRCSTSLELGECAEPCAACCTCAERLIEGPGLARRHLFSLVILQAVAILTLHTNIFVINLNLVVVVWSFLSFSGAAV